MSLRQAITLEEIRLPGDVKYRVTAYHVLHQAIHLMRLIGPKEEMDFDVLMKPVPFLLKALDQPLPSALHNQIETSLTHLLIALVPYWTDWNDVLAPDMRANVEMLRTVFQDYGKDRLLSMVDHVKSRQENLKIPLYPIYLLTGFGFMAMPGSLAPSDVLMNSETPESQNILAGWMKEGSMKNFPVAPGRPYDVHLAFQRLTHFLEEDLRSTQEFSDPRLATMSVDNILERLPHEGLNPKIAIDFVLSLSLLPREEVVKTLLAAKRHLPLIRGETSLSWIHSQWIQQLNTSAYVEALAQRIVRLVHGIENESAEKPVLIRRKLPVDLLPWILKYGYVEPVEGAVSFPEVQTVELSFAVLRYELKPDLNQLGLSLSGIRLSLQATQDLPDFLKRRPWFHTLRMAELKDKLAGLETSRLRMVPELEPVYPHSRTLENSFLLMSA